MVSKHYLPSTASCHCYPQASRAYHKSIAAPEAFDSARPGRRASSSPYSCSSDIDRSASSKAADSYIARRMFQKGKQSSGKARKGGPLAAKRCVPL